jgi:hypothetical protein
LPLKSASPAENATKAKKPSTKPTPKKQAPAKKAAKPKAPSQPQAPAQPVGRPSSFRSEYIGQAKRLAALGATDVEVADFFGVCVATLFNWRADFPEFLEATRLGKQAADDRVEQRLFARAMGYEHDEVDIRVVNGSVVQTQIRKFYPPDTAAASFWLRNRRPNDWRDKVEAVHTGPDGGPIQARIAVEFVRPAPSAETE